jgi:hypothetical protein
MHKSTKPNKTNSVHDKNVKSKCLPTKVTPLYDQVVVLKRAGLALSRPRRERLCGTGNGQSEETALLLRRCVCSICDVTIP